MIRISRAFWAIFIAAVLVGFLVPELHAYFHGQPTLSQAVWSWTGDFWPLGLGVGGFGAGLLCGHWWWPQRIQ